MQISTPIYTIFAVVGIFGECGDACFGWFSSLTSVVSGEGEEGVLWAVLVCGSNTWENYRHQADVAAVYQVLSIHGVPNERIITMLYDDVAWDKQNPFPGELYHYYDRTGHLSWDMYKGMPKDFTGKDVNKVNFAKLMLGSDMSGIGTGKTLQSGPKDRVIVYFADHGAINLISLLDDVIYSDELQLLLEKMHERKLFKNLVMYMEACESGSMFEGLRDDIGVYAVTASNSTVNSIASFCQIEGFTCLSDTFTYILTQNAFRQRSLLHETLNEQFALIESHLLDSPARRYGDIKGMGNMLVGEFFGSANATRYVDKPIYLGPVMKIDAHDVPKHSLKKDIEQILDDDAESQAKKDNLEKELKTLEQNREYAQSLVRRIVRDSVKLKIANKEVNESFVDQVLNRKTADAKDMKCYKRLWNSFTNKCLHFHQHPYVFNFGGTFANLCDVEFMNSLTETGSGSSSDSAKTARRPNVPPSDDYEDIIGNICAILVHKPRRTL